MLIAEEEQTTCPICHRTDGDIVWEEKGYKGRLDDCGVLCIEPSPGKLEADMIIENHAEGYYAIPAETRMAWIKRSKESGALLEVGCGTGTFAEILNSSGFDVTGVEPHANRCNSAREQRGIKVVNEWIENFDTQPDFDVVFNLDLLSHFPDPELALRKMKSAMKPDGVLCLEVGIMGDISPLWYRLTGEVGFPSHRRLYSEPALFAMFENAGFEVSERRRFNLVPSILVIRLRKILWPIVGLVLTHDDPSEAAIGSQGKAHVMYDRVVLFLRYNLGRWLPKTGPMTAFYTLKHRKEDEGVES